MTKNQEEKAVPKKLTPEEIALCTAVLEQLNADTNQIFEIAKDKRLALIMAAGTFSRPSREEFLRRKKEAKKAAKRKIKQRDKQARNETGIRSARDATIFIAPTMIALTGEEAKEEVELKSPRNCYVCKAVFTKLHHFYDTMCKECGDFNYASDTRPLISLDK